MENGVISIIVPIYKVEDTLDKCVKSLMQQTYKDIEIILVDDGSPDRCPEICDKYAKLDNRIKVIHKENGGLSDARNTGLKAASGYYIMYVDSDDYLETDACKRLLDNMQPDVDFVVGAIRQVRGQKIIYQRHTNLISEKKYSSKVFVIKSIQKNEWFAPAVLNLYKRNFLLSNQLFFKIGYYYEDMEILLRLYLSAKNIVYVDYPFYNYIIRENSIMTSNITEKKRKMAIAIYSEWMRIILDIQDEEYQKYLFGILSKYYITSARHLVILGWKVDKLDFNFAWKYALGWRERLNILLFNFFPKIKK
ncbi:glycosyltransferase family 2 protein [Faecalicoccus pleomorphus]|uniref:glycosyltransferase family 2 protein n=1 Tax=Faecalicoccus pleomorphus TaxID=1323 RepID=UPI0014314133|nr:glycosyltransferase family 2 protein [Faecalicoccus pleomorphus]NJE41509.1 glycosyltransferase family 2 protein [Faecalicoccus pleomorphus]